MPETRALAIVGYGKMGRMIEQFAPEYGFSVALKLDEFNNANFEGVTGHIEFDEHGDLKNGEISVYTVQDSKLNLLASFH